MKAKKCHAGHLLTKSNIYGTGECKICKRAFAKDWRRKNAQLLGKNGRECSFKVGDPVRAKTPEMIRPGFGSIVVILPGWIFKVFVPGGTFTNCQGTRRLVHHIYAKSDQLSHQTGEMR